MSQEVIVIEAAKPAVKAPARARNWCFTLNNYSEGDVEFLTSFEPAPRYLLAGKERSVKGTPHLQGQVCFETLKALHQVKLILGPRYHLEITQDLAKSIGYCKKGSGTADAPVEPDWFERGSPPDTPAEKGKKEQDRWALALDAAQRGAFEEIAPQIQVCQARTLEYIHTKKLRETPLENTFEPMLWYYGETGSGKTRLARESNPKAYIKNMNKWWCAYNGQDVAIIDEVQPAHCTAELTGDFKRWSDHYPFNAEVKCSHIMARPRQLIVTSNYTIQECFPDPRDYLPIMRRFDQWEFAKGKEPVLTHARGTEPAKPDPGRSVTFVPTPLHKFDETENEEERLHRQEVVSAGLLKTETARHTSEVWGIKQHGLIQRQEDADNYARFQERNKKREEEKRAGTFRPPVLVSGPRTGRALSPAEEAFRAKRKVTYEDEEEVELVDLSGTLEAREALEMLGERCETPWPATQEMGCDEDDDEEEE